MVAKRTRSKRRLTPGRVFVYRILVGLAKLMVETLWWTCRIRYVGLGRFQALVREHGAVVPVCWHQHLLICARFTVSRHAAPIKPGFMISPSVDGEAPTMLAMTYGAHVVRGSGTYSGLRAVRGAHQAIERDGISPLVTPDGPRGPRFKFKPGALFTGQISRKPVVPMAFAARPARVLKTWDKFVIPWPFSRIYIALGEPCIPPAELTDEQMQALQVEMEQRMQATFKLAKQALEARAPK